MSEPAFLVEGLSKRYRIGLKEKVSDTFGGAMAAWLKAPFSNLKNLKELVNFEADSSEAKDVIWALKDVSFEVKPGEVIGIIGRNGAGKSTLLKILSRITEPTSGRAIINGRVSSLLEVGTGFHQELTGRENVYLNGTILGMSKKEIDRKFDEIVAFSEVEAFLDTPVKRYSSGMKVRLAFAVAAHLEPEILLIDEVLAVGDASFQKKCLGKMGEVATEGRTVLFVSHNMGAVNRLCEKACLFLDGRLVDSGETGAIIQQYLEQQLSGSDGDTTKGFKRNRESFERHTHDDFYFEDIDIFNPEPSSLGPRTGGPLTIKLFYKIKKDFFSPAFLVSIKSFVGQEVLRLSTRPISGFNIERLFDRGIIELSLTSLDLVAGRYYVDIGLARENVEWIAKLENVAEFDVLAHDIYGSGVLLDQSAGLIVTKHRWDHIRND